ncbi:MAG TPA: YceI family protein [Candidatus Acidoferrales bacterium]|nr:YceI family protein [Candidatus Acidoferrales bacterium]
MPPLAKRKRKACFALLALVAALILSTGVRAEELVVTLDPARTEIHYMLGAVAHTVHGTFKLKSGAIRFDPATGKVSGSIVVDATTGNSGNDGRDSKMHREILESQKYPEIVFTPQQVKGTVNQQGASQIEVSGIFRLHGQDHQVTLPLALQLNGPEATASTQFSIPYQQWGLKNPSTFILRVKDTVDLDIHAVAHVSPASK